MAKNVNEAMTAIADSIRENSEKTLNENISGKLSLSDMPNAINAICRGRYNMGVIETHDKDNGKVLRLANRLVDGEYERAVDIDLIVNTAISDFDSVKESIKNYQVGVPSGTPTSEYGYLIKEACDKAFNDGSSDGYMIGFNEGQGQVYEEIQQPLDSAIEKIQQYAYGGEGDPGYSVLSKITYIDENVLNVYKTGEAEGEGRGQAIGRDNWWIEYQRSCESNGYQFAFSRACWTDNIYTPVIKIVAKADLNHNEMFRNSTVKDVRVAVEFRQSGATYIFSTPTLERIPLLEVDEKVTFTNWFANCTSLTEITMSGAIGNDIDFRYSLLNKSSIQSIVNCLSSTASGKTLTLNESAVIDAFGSLSSQEWLNLINTKSNWKISTILKG